MNQMNVVLKTFTFFIGLIFSFLAVAQDRSLKSLVYELEQSYSIEICYDSIEIAALKFEIPLIKKSGYISRMSNRFDITLQKDTSIIKQHLQLLIKEFRIYPNDYFQRIGMKFLCLLQSVYYGKSKREAVPDNFRETLMLESSDRLIDKTTYLKYAFHHDLHHYAEHGTDLDLRRKWEKWDRLNPRKFKYFGSGAMQDDERFAHVNFHHFHPYDGFITNYALTAAVEDRADIVAYFLITEYREQVMPLLLEDKRLKKKVDFMLDLLNEISGTTDNYWMDALQASYIDTH
ncbi:MAG: hypothetical protein RIC03_00215 [Cyclobacteriaceae bacterium]